MKKLKKSLGSGNISVFLPITKVDSEKRLVYGIITEEIVDKAGEVFDYAGSKPYFKAWSEGIEKATGGKSKGNVRVMHTSKAVGKLTDLVFDDDALKMEASAKIVDDDEWKKVEEGVYTGFSIGGRYVKRWKDGDQEKFIADPVEVSIVDNPAVPTATFQLVKADGVIEVPFKIWAPDNADIAKRATALALKAGKPGAWIDYVDSARSELIKEHAAEETKAAEDEAEQISMSEAKRILDSEDMDEAEKIKAIRALAGAAPEAPEGFTADKVRAVIDSEDMDDSAKSKALYAMIKEESGEEGMEEEAEEEEAEDEEGESDESADKADEEEDSYKATEEEMESAKSSVSQVWKCTDGKTFTKKSSAVLRQAAINAGSAGEALAKAIKGLKEDLSGEVDQSLDATEFVKTAAQLRGLVKTRDSEALKKHYECSGPGLYHVERLACLLEGLASMCNYYNEEAVSAPKLKEQVVSMGALLVEVAMEAVASLMNSIGAIAVEEVSASSSEAKEAFARVGKDLVEKLHSKGLVAKKAEEEGLLAKAQSDATEAKAEAQRLKKIVDEAVPAIEELRKQVQALKKQPGPPAHRGIVVGKEQDAGAPRAIPGVDELTAALQKMTPEERATLAIKVSQASPISAMNRGERT